MDGIVAKYILFTYLLFLTGCTGFFHSKTFIDEMERESDGFFVPGRDFEVVSGDTGQQYRTEEEIIARTPKSSRSRLNYLHQRSIEKELSQLESRLDQSESKDYQSIKNHLLTPSEKIYFLNLSPEGQNAYLASKNIQNRRAKHYSNMFIQKKLTLGKNIYLGMDKQAVIRAWGRPTEIDVAGDPRNQNERWTFYNNKKTKIIFFERGLVDGWSIE